MKKKSIVMMALALVMVSSVVGFAAAPTVRPASILEDVTGLTWEEIRTERIENKKTSGQIAETVGKLGEYKTALINFYTERMKDHVEIGRLTKEEADARIAEITSFIKGASASDLDNRMGFGGRNGSGMMAGNGMRSNGCDYRLNDGTGSGLKNRVNQGNGLANGSGLFRDGTGPRCNK